MLNKFNSPSAPRQRHPGHNQGQGQSLYSDKDQEHHPTSQEQTSYRRIHYNPKPEYVSSDSRDFSASRTQALESPGSRYNTFDPVERNQLQKGGNVYDSNSLERGVYRPGESVSQGLSGVGGTSDDTGYSQRTNTIPDIDFQQPIGNKRQYGSSNNRLFPTYENVDTKKTLLTVPNTIDDVNFHWVISGFTDCSTTCGGGMYALDHKKVNSL